MPADVERAVAVLMPVTREPTSVYPVQFACPSAVLRDPATGLHYGMGEIASPWAGAVAETGLTGSLASGHSRAGEVGDQATMAKPKAAKEEQEVNNAGAVEGRKEDRRQAVRKEKVCDKEEDGSKKTGRQEACPEEGCQDERAEAEGRGQAFEARAREVDGKTILLYPEAAFGPALNCVGIARNS
jgi:hypothetical protein